MGLPAAGLASLGLNGVSGLLGAAGSIQGGEAQSAAYKYQSAVALRNAAISAQQGDIVQQEGQAQAQQAYQAGSQRLGMARAAYGANGVLVSSGSAADAQSGIARTTALNTNAISFDADARSVGYRNQASNLFAQAGIDRTDASGAIRAGDLGAFGSLIGSASSVASKWDQFRQNAPQPSTSPNPVDPWAGVGTGSGWGSV